MVTQRKLIAMAIMMVLVSLLFFQEKTQAQSAVEKPFQTYIPSVLGNGVQAKNLVQVQFGNGIVSNLTVTNEPTQCTTGTVLDLTTSPTEIVGNGYYFSDLGLAISPSIKEVDGQEQVFLVTIGTATEYLVFWPPATGINAVSITPGHSEVFDLSQPSQYQGVDVSLNENQVTLLGNTSTVWITRQGDFFCVVIQTLDKATDNGIFKFFIDNGFLPSGQELENFLYN